MSSFRRMVRSPRVQKCIGLLAAEYLRCVWKTSAFAIDPPDFYERVVPDLPVIVAMWHGHHFMMPFFRRDPLQARVLISRHRDGEINAIASERLGVGAIRGSGSLSGDYNRKGGVAGFRGLAQALAQGCNVALTADIPKVSRVAGRGIIELARVSGRAIYPVIPATSRRIQLDNWDRSAVNLPFSRFAIAVGEPVRVAADADADTVEAARRTLQERLNRTFERAYALVDGRAKDFDWNADRRRARAA